MIMPTPTITPALRYADGPAAIDFLCRAFGFEKHLVVPGPENTVAHAQLTCGHGMIMLSSAPSDFNNIVKPPNLMAGQSSLCICVVIPDPDAHHARAKAAGAQIMQEPQDKPYGGRDYLCRDPEGYIWCFGSYDPWA